MYLNLRKFAKIVREIMSAQFLCFLGTIVHISTVLQKPTLYELVGFVFVLDVQ